MKIVRKIFASVNYIYDICSVESLRIVLYYISKNLYIVKVKYDRARVMRSAWKQFKGHFNTLTFGQCLSNAWATAKKNAKKLAKIYKQGRKLAEGTYLDSPSKYDRVMRSSSKGSRIAKCERIASNMYNYIKA